MGRFTALEDSDDDPELDGSDHDDEEAPYAYVARLSAPVNVSGMDAKDCDPADGLDSRQGGAALDVLPRELTTDSQGYFPNGQSQQALPQVRGEEVSGSASDTNMLSVEDTDLSSYVGSSQPSCTQSPASIPGSEFPFSLDSELNQASTPVAVEEPKSSTRTEGDNSTETGVLLNSGPAHAQTPSLSQEGFSIEGTKPAPGMPQQLPTFLIPFSGSLIKVPANGQCAYAALYASTTASAEPRLQFTSEVVKDANIIKRSIYTLMMINLANDVECKVVDPCRELKRLYPSQPAPLDVAVATAALYTHYEQERNRSVNAHIPSEFWAGPEVLRAMAQYLREPLFVLDVDINNDSHVQRYFYQDYTLRNGDIHEIGCGGALTDADAKLMLGHYARLHVLPVLLVLKRHEGHFYGVNAGDVATKWQAEGDREFATQHCASHRWYSEVMAHMDYCQGLLAQVDVTQDEDATNEILIGAMERRDRLDVIHERLGLARLESDHYDIAILESGLRAEGDRLHRVAGPAGSAYRLEPKAQAGGADALVVQRAPITPQGRVALSTMQRILDSINGDPEIIADRSKLRQLQAENAAAIDTWRRKVSPGLRPPTLLGGAGHLPALMNWLVEHREALRSCFACVPYPELAAKCLPMELLVQWGELEVYDLQVATLREVINAEAPSKPTKEYCRTWLAACIVDGGSPRDLLLARDEGRWDRLVVLYANAPSCAKPRDVSEACWHVLHTLPHVVCTWETTPWGTTHRRHLGAIYQAHPAVRQLCEQITARTDWGGAVRLPSGITWDDRQASMGAGPAAPFRG